MAGLEGRLLMSPPATLTVAHLDKFPDRSDLPTKFEANVGNNVLISCGVPESNPPAIVQVLIFKFSGHCFTFPFQWEKDGAMLNMSGDHSTLVSSGLLLLQVTVKIYLISSSKKGLYVFGQDFLTNFWKSFGHNPWLFINQLFRTFKLSMVESMPAEPATT